MDSDIQKLHEPEYKFKLNDLVFTPKGNGMFFSYDDAEEFTRAVVYVNENKDFAFFEFFQLNEIKKL